MHAVNVISTISAHTLPVNKTHCDSVQELNIDCHVENLVVSTCPPNLSQLVLQYLFRLTAGRQEHDAGEKDLKVEDINIKLNELAASNSAEEKTAVLQWLVQRSSARMLKWITQIILKDLKVLPGTFDSCSDISCRVSSACNRNACIAATSYSECWCDRKEMLNNMRRCTVSCKDAYPAHHYLSCD